MKRCPVCKRDLPLEDYASNKSRADGLQYACRGCWKVYACNSAIGSLREDRENFERAVKYLEENRSA